MKKKYSHSRILPLSRLEAVDGRQGGELPRKMQKKGLKLKVKIRIL